jgi:hypothetical protein
MGANMRGVWRMMDPWRVLSMCQGKLPMTGAEARLASKNHRRRGKGDIDVYKCKVCGTWHLGGTTVTRRDRLETRRRKQWTDDAEEEGPE